MAAAPGRGSIAIVGAAESDLGEVAPGMTPIDLMAQGIARALEDCGLALKDIDGVFAATAQSRAPTLALCEYLRIKPRYNDSSNSGGSVFESMVMHAQAAIEAGMCEVAVVAYGSTQRSAGGKLISTRSYDPFISPYNLRLPASAYALAASRHMHEFGTTREQLAAVAVAARQWALMNPQAWEKAPLTIAEVLGARMVSAPLSVRDCCLVTDGGGAVILTSAARARSLRKAPVYVLGAADAISHNDIHSMGDLTVTAAVESGKAAYAIAGLGPEDIDVALLYDAFTINTILFLEDLGFCPKGEGGPFAASGRIAPGGDLPVNTNGGGLSYCHPGMYGLLLLIEAVRQLRGECGARQVPGAEIALVHGNGGTLSSQATVILGSAATV
jgi:acetyl-CoA acetyltransferase